MTIDDAQAIAGMAREGADFTADCLRDALLVMQDALVEEELRGALFSRCLHRAVKLYRAQHPTNPIAPSGDKALANAMITEGIAVLADWAREDITDE